MKHVRQFVQDTVMAKSAEEFDDRMNELYKKASASGREPEIHYFDSLGLCASIRYWDVQDIPETLAEAYEARGERHYCCECPCFRLPEDKRIRYVRCEEASRTTTASSCACDIYYQGLEVRHAS